MVYYGYNYEDGIVVSDKLVNEDTFTSVHYVDLTFEIPPNKILENLNDDYENYKPLPDIFDKLKKGDTYGKVRTVWSEGFNDVIFEPVNEMTVPEDCVITDIKMYVNKWDKSFLNMMISYSHLWVSKKARKKNMFINYQNISQEKSLRNL